LPNVYENIFNYIEKDTFEAEPTKKQKCEVELYQKDP